MILDLTNIHPFLEEGQLEEIMAAAIPSLETVLNKSGPGSAYLGWMDIPEQEGFSLGGYTLSEIQEVAGELREKAATLVCIGIGGSYLGHRMVIEALQPTTERILFAGQNIDANHLQHILDIIGNRKEVYLNPISKSGTTTEPGIAFRVLRKWLERRYGESGAAQRIIATTDSDSGALRQLADERGMRTFPVPDDVGGRYSVLTPVGLFPIAA
ncbi:MAG TPA: glucose-6-phosphate isomerase, partial [bacterium]|nr:glucose-6-phosphate isomerase [bacterium]